MSVLLLVNPDRYDTSKLSRYWHDDLDVDVTASGYEGRPGWIGTSEDAYVVRMVRPSADQSFVMGARFKVDALPVADKILLAAVDDDQAIQVCVVLKTTGLLALYRGDMVDLLATSVVTVNGGGAWNRISWKGTIDRTAGSMELQLNSTRTNTYIVATVVGENTAPEDSRRWGGAYLGVTDQITAAHLYVLDGAGTQNQIIPDAIVTPMVANADGTFTEWTPNSGTTRYTQIDDASPDDSSTFIKATIPDDDFSVEVEELDEAATAGIIAAQITIMAQSTVTPQRRLRPFVVVDGVQRFYSEQAIPSSYAAMMVVSPVNPATGLPWKVTDINDVEWGARLR
jgi:hypothetical protein